MVRVDGPKTLTFRVERLEERCLLAGVLPWPIKAPDVIQSIAATYGQFDNRLPEGEGGIHFHSGIDIGVAAGTKVYAIEGGTVHKAGPFNEPAGFLSIATNDASGWNYLHIYPDSKWWSKGAKVSQGDYLGVVTYEATVNAPPHLHLEAAGGVDETHFYLAPIADPLTLLTPIGDTTAPTVGDIHFMRGEDDSGDPHDLDPDSGTASHPPAPPSKYLLNQNEVPRSKNHGYFDTPETNTPQAWIVGHLAPNTSSLGGSSNIEVIANATDKVKGDWQVGIQSISFSAKGKFAGKEISTVTPYSFEGIFVWDPQRPAGTQDYDALHISDLTRVVYENDYKSPSNAAPSVGAVSYFHILTNTDGILDNQGKPNTVVDFADRTRYWRSKVTQGAAWNDINSTEAVNNAKGAFPDDYYTITVTAKDAAGNVSQAKTERVLLDNWQQQVIVVMAPNNKGEVRGTQFLPNTLVPIYALPPFGKLADGATISKVTKFLGKALTDADGNIKNFVVDLTDPDIGSVVADYGADDIYVGRLDAIAPVQVGIALRAPRFVAGSAGDSGHSDGSEQPPEDSPPGGGSQGFLPQGYLPPEDGAGGIFFAPPADEVATGRDEFVRVDGPPDQGFRHSRPDESAVITFVPAVSPPGLDPGEGLWLDSLGTSA